MADQPSIYLAKIDGEDGIKLYRSTDPRLVRRHIIENLIQPNIEVRRPTTDEAMCAALDGVAVIDLTKKAVTAEPDLLTREDGDAEAGADNMQRLSPDTLSDGERLYDNDGNDVGEHLGEGYKFANRDDEPR